MDYQAVLAEVWDGVRPVLGQGRVATYIPALAAVDPRRFG
ncbi:glutaminase, partial [Corallococcus sp. AB049A]